MKRHFISLLKSPVRLLINQLNNAVYKYHLSRQITFIPDSGIYLYYAGQSLPSEEGIIHGGRVKLAHLAELFPETPSNPTIIYLVSSALPEHAKVLVNFLKNKGVRLVWNQNGVAYPAWAGDSYKSTNSRLATFLHEADYVIYQSEFCRLSADRYLGKPAVPHRVLFNPVDTEKFSPIDEPPSTATWKLLVTGTHLQPDRVLLILKALQVLKNRGHNVRLTIAGRLGWPDGEMQTRNAIKNFGLADNVTIFGSYTQDQAPALYQAAHILLHIKYKDPCPTVPIEAMSCGVPVVGSMSGGMPELVSEEGGVLIDVPDEWDKMYYPEHDQIVHAVIDIMGDINNWRIKARQRALKYFSKSVWLAQHKLIFSELVNDM